MHPLPHSSTKIGFVKRFSYIAPADFSFFYQDLMFFINKNARADLARALQMYFKARDLQLYCLIAICIEAMVMNLYKRWRCKA